MLSTESRMRGDMQVRFGGRYGKTYCQKAVRRSVPSLRLGRGGNIIALAGVLYASDHVPYLLGKIAEQAPHIRPISFSFRQQASEPSFQHLEVGELTHPALLRYLQERGINIALAKAQCKELHFTHNGKPYFAIGFPNVAGGFEVRNRFFKGCVAPKDISHIRQQGEAREKCLVFEGMMDYLSFLTLRKRNCSNLPDLDRQDYVILNSTANVSKAIDVLHGYGRIHCMLDNDEAGKKGVSGIGKEVRRTHPRLLRQLQRA